MNIALDFDGTYNQDPEAWSEVAFILNEWDHNVYILTNRPFHKRKDVEEVVLQGPFQSSDIHFCGQEPKRTVAKKNNLDIDVWIDNNPESIILCP
jgi:ribonucleotide monophosphatase NagD (HAD superfamily)